MGYNFPANPSNGQVYGPYTFDGDAWVGGLAVGPQQDQRELFVDLAGLASKDILVPSWAKGVEILASVFLLAGTAAPVLQVSAMARRSYGRHAVWNWWLGIADGSRLGPS